MKTLLTKYTFLSLLFLCAINMVNAQDQTNNNPTSNINMVARYLAKNNAVEIRFFPDKKQVLHLGLKNGFIIERAELTPKIDKIENLDFKIIGKTIAFTESQWNTLLANNANESHDNIELAKDFFDAVDKNEGGSFSFDKGIKELKEQKSKEDFEYLVFVLNAIKDKNVAQALGLSFLDTSVEPNKTYIYKISSEKPSNIYNINSVPYSIETKDENNVVQRKIYVKPGDTELSFLWEEKDMVSGAIVERKNNATGVWEKLTKAPIYSLGSSIRNGFKDTNLTNYQTYEYRFFGYNPFGEKIMFGTATGMPKDFTPPKKPIFKMAKHTKPNEITIAWETDKPEDGDLKGFLVARGTSNKGQFKVLHNNVLPKTTTQFIDKSFDKNEQNYYVIQAIDTSGNVSSTVPAFVTLIDSIPPKKPKFISGKIDSLGVVTLNVALNEEKDLMGYRLFRSNSEKHEFSVIQEGFNPNDSIQKPVQVTFLDTVTLKSLTPYIYYRIIALDYNFNQSEFSDILKVKRPDKIKPTTPVFKNVIVGESSIELHFALSRSIDVVEQTLYRKLALKEPWKLIAKLEDNQTTFTDKNLKKGTTYYYTIQAVDDSKNKSDFAKPVAGKPYDNGVRPTVENITVQKNKTEIRLSWKYPLKNENTYFVIYKKDKKGNLKQYNNTSNLYFTEPISKEKATYAVKVFTKDGGQSKISREVTIN